MVSFSLPLILFFTAVQQVAAYPPGAYVATGWGHCYHKGDNGVKVTCPNAPTGLCTVSCSQAQANVRARVSCSIVCYGGGSVDKK
ncbi:hypothetical protein E2P81_ATG02967 [Venturia nashicola]|uniref:Secreted protein n=1 Tax=Venturia nashicola TaxID=86259 RepID=A0A4Z1P3J7_9PEZI|nr:hypothetical protein E6O75_ATG03029 [Venturia nashicola]TLD36078.1 hypothetical protein E2P81_ATG02967 [Venturia nashicola]